MNFDDRDVQVIKDRLKLIKSIYNQKLDFLQEENRRIMADNKEKSKEETISKIEQIKEKKKDKHRDKDKDKNKDQEKKDENIDNDQWNAPSDSKSSKQDKANKFEQTKENRKDKDKNKNKEMENLDNNQWGDDWGDANSKKNETTPKNEQAKENKKDRNKNKESEKQKEKEKESVDNNEWGGGWNETINATAGTDVAHDATFDTWDTKVEKKKEKPASVPIASVAAAAAAAAVERNAKHVESHSVKSTSQNYKENYSSDTPVSSCSNADLRDKYLTAKLDLRLHEIEKKKLQEELDRVKIERDSILAKLNDRRHEHESMAMKVRQLTIDLITSNEEASALHRKVGDLENELDQTRRELVDKTERFEAEMEHSQMLIRALREGCQLVESQAKTFEDRHDTVRMSKEELERDLLAIKEEASRHITKITKLEGANAKLNAALEKSVRQNEKLRNEYNAKIAMLEIQLHTEKEQAQQFRNLAFHLTSTRR